jgi:collagen triple helix repeat protein
MTSGPRGRKGAKGALGERGPHGDHGQTGDTGETGATGATGASGLRGRMPRSVGLSFLTAALVIAGVLSLLAWEVVKTRQLVRENTKTRIALCAQRVDMDAEIARERRGIVRTEKLLRQYRGRFVFKIPRRLIVQGLAENKAELRQSLETRENFAILDCKE